jgi:hypothetical protein
LRVGFEEGASKISARATLIAVRCCAEDDIEIIEDKEERERETDLNRTVLE